MEFRLLGPLEVVEHNRALALGGVKQRSLLAILLLHADEVVSADRLIDELWGQTPPLTASKSIQVYVSRLRKQLGADRLVTQDPGYALHVGPSELDLACFEQLVAEARRADAEGAAQMLRRALALWRGTPLADLGYEPFAQAEIARLEELRWAALEHRIDADLACGGHADLIGELRALVGEQPLRERLRSQLMLALYRSARQAEALDAYRETSRELSEELGLEPSDELKRLERAILQQDPVLDLAQSSPRQARANHAPVSDRSLLVVPGALEGVAPVLRLAKPLAASEMKFRILGPLEVWDEGGEVLLGGHKPRALLAVLLLHPNEVVPANRLIDELWGEDPPERAAAALRVNVSRLRKALPQDVLTTRSPGYVIRVEPDDLDLHRFERLVDEARGLRARGLPADASERLRDALSLWRGPALADFAYESFAQTAIARLEEIRLAAVELRIDADLALGRHDELAGELEALVAEQPLRERLRTYLMTALYRSGRQAEALDAYKDARRALVDELGIEPSPALQELERAILRQEPALNLPATVSASAGEAAERSILVAMTHETRVDALLAVAEPLVRDPPRSMILARLVSDVVELRSSSAWLEERRSALEARGVVARAAAFTSTAPGAELARLATELDVDLLLAAAPDELLAEGAPDQRLTALLAETPCDVALLVPRDATPAGPVLVPFGGAEHDWAAVELGAWFARASDAPLWLAGAAAVPEHGRRDASRLLSHGALAVQRVVGISAEPLLAPPGDEGMLEASRDAGLLVVGLSTRWHREGLGPARLRLAKEATPPTLLVRRGLRPGGLAPPPALTRFTWSIRP